MRHLWDDDAYRSWPAAAIHRSSGPRILAQRPLTKRRSGVPTLKHYQIGGLSLTNNSNGLCADGQQKVPWSCTLSAARASCQSSNLTIIAR